MKDRESKGRPQASVDMDQGMRALSYLISGILVYGGLGWLGDHYLDTKFLLPIGIILGAAAGIWMVIRRFGDLPSRHTEKSQVTSVEPAAPVHKSDTEHQSKELPE